MIARMKIIHYHKKENLWNMNNTKRNIQEKGIKTKAKVNRKEK